MGQMKISILDHSINVSVSFFLLILCDSFAIFFCCVSFDLQSDKQVDSIVAKNIRELKL